MHATTLGDFIRELERRGELKRIKHPVSARLEIAEIADRMVKQAGPALLFENVRETPNVPVAIGLYASHQRMALALHDKPQAIANRIEQLLKTVPPEGLLGKLQTGMKLMPGNADNDSLYIVKLRRRAAMRSGSTCNCPHPIAARTLLSR